MISTLNRVLQGIGGWFKQFFKPNAPQYITVYIDELPVQLQKLTVYVLGESEHLWSTAMICPCGCGELLQMSLHKQGRPRWELTNHGDGTVSLSPSVWRKVGCKSHFFLKHGRIIWCEDRN